MHRRRELLRWATVIALTVAGGHSLAQEESPPTGWTPATHRAEWRIPAGVKPRATAGETLLLSTSGKSQAVRSYCELGDNTLVVLPTGELSLVKRAATQPTSSKFVAASPSELEAGLKSAGLTDFKFVDAKPYLFAYACSEAFFLHTRSILESMLSGVLAELRAWGLKAADPSLPLVVIIMPGRAEFDAYDKDDKVSPEVVAYYDPRKNHVVLYEDQNLWEAAPEFAAKQASYLIAHESMHQLLTNSGIQRRLSHWPMWITEGVPEYFCPLKVNSIIDPKTQLPRRTIKWGKPGMVNDLRMYELLQMRGGEGDAIKNLLQATTLDSKGYALAWGLVHHLANKRRPEFQAYLRDISQYKPLDQANKPLAGRPDRMFIKHFGGDFKAIEQAVLTHVTSKKMLAEYKDPVVNQTHFVGVRTKVGGRESKTEAILTTSPAEAREWKKAQEAKFKKKPYIKMKSFKTRSKAEFEFNRALRQ